MIGCSRPRMSEFAKTRSQLSSWSYRVASPHSKSRQGWRGFGGWRWWIERRGSPGASPLLAGSLSVLPDWRKDVTNSSNSSRRRTQVIDGGSSLAPGNGVAGRCPMPVDSAG